MPPSFTIRPQTPDVGVPISRAGDDPVGLWRPIDACDSEVVLVQLSHFVPLETALHGVDFDLFIVFGEGHLGSVGVECVGRDGGHAAAESVTRLSRRHFKYTKFNRGLWSVYTIFRSLCQNINSEDRNEKASSLSHFSFHPPHPSFVPCLLLTSYFPAARVPGIVR